MNIEVSLPCSQEHPISSYKQEAPFSLPVYFNLISNIPPMYV
jgi:hypothetical protein